MDVEDMKNPTEVCVWVVCETDKAVCVTEGSLYNQDEQVWLPKPKIHTEDTIYPGYEIIITMPEWLAVDKGLV